MFQNWTIDSNKHYISHKNPGCADNSLTVVDNPIAKSATTAVVSLVLFC